MLDLIKKNEKKNIKQYMPQILVAFIILIGILKENKKIQTSVFNFGIISEIVYMIYLYILDTSIYRYIIYIPIFILMRFINNNKKTNEKLKIITFIIFILIGISEVTMILVG